MEFRPLTDAEVAAPPPWLAHVDLRPDLWRDASTRAAGGWVEGRLVAVGRIYTSRIHTSRYWTEIEVAPDYRRGGHGRQMLHHLADLRPRPRPLCTRGYVSSEPIAFGRHLGARPYQTCPPQHVATGDAGQLTAATAPTVAASEIDPEELQRAWIDTYTWVHASWSPITPGSEPLLAAELADLDLTHTRLVATPTVRAAAFVFPDSTGTVVVAETRTPTEPAGLDLLRACVRDSLLSLAASDVTGVTFDGHDTDPHFRPLLNELPTRGEAFELLEWTPGNDR